MGSKGIPIEGQIRKRYGSDNQKEPGGNAGVGFGLRSVETVEGNGIIEIISGKWYFAVRCKSCGRQILFFPDENRGRRPVIVSMPVAVSCPYCKKDHSCEQTHISSVPAPV